MGRSCSFGGISFPLRQPPTLLPAVLLDPAPLSYVFMSFVSQFLYSVNIFAIKTYNKTKKRTPQDAQFLKRPTIRLVFFFCLFGLIPGSGTGNQKEFRALRSATRFHLDGPACAAGPRRAAGPDPLVACGRDGIIRQCSCIHNFGQVTSIRVSIIRCSSSASRVSAAL